MSFQAYLKNSQTKSNRRFGNKILVFEINIF